MKYIDLPYIVNLLHHLFADLKIHTFCRGLVSWPRMSGLLSISKLCLSLFSSCSLLPPSYILCWREQSEVISIWFEINRADSEGKTRAGGTDASLLSPLSMQQGEHKFRVHAPSFHLPAQKCHVQSDSRCSGRALSSLTLQRCDVPVRCHVIPSFSQQWWNTALCLSVNVYLLALA